MIREVEGRIEGVLIDWDLSKDLDASSAGVSQVMERTVSVPAQISFATVSDRLPIPGNVEFHGHTPSPPPARTVASPRPV